MCSPSPSRWMQVKNSADTAEPPPQRVFVFESTAKGFNDLTGVMVVMAGTIRVDPDTPLDQRGFGT